MFSGSTFGHILHCRPFGSWKVISHSRIPGWRLSIDQVVFLDPLDKLLEGAVFVRVLTGMQLDAI